MLGLKIDDSSKKWILDSKDLKDIFKYTFQAFGRIMASGVTLQESEKNAPEGFFPKLYENVCKTMTENDLNKMPEEHDSNEKFIR